ncbi:P-loop NTPase, partial [Staphylococcus aureus]|uniref:P-loop NTPase n=1 Tax=Staphylococcus aureus TaxID=1280 RepID=UPI0037D9BA6A
MPIPSAKRALRKSTVPLNLPLPLPPQPKKLLLLHPHIYPFTLPHIIPIHQNPPIKANQLIPVQPHPLKLISIPFFLQQNPPLISTPPILPKIFTNFFTQLKSPHIQYLILHLPPPTPHLPLHLHTILPSTNQIILTTPH